MGNEDSREHKKKTEMGVNGRCKAYEVMKGRDKEGEEFLKGHAKLCLKNIKESRKERLGVKYLKV